MISKNNLIHKKSRDFAVRIVKMVAYYDETLSYTYRPVFQQILKSGTSIGANIRESQYAESSEDFVHKLKIALKEANETDFWLDVFHNADILSNNCMKVLVLIVRS